MSIEDKIEILEKNESFGRNESSSENNSFLSNENFNKIILNKFPNSKGSPESNDSGIQTDELHQLNNDFCHLYSTVNKKKSNDINNSENKCEKIEEDERGDDEIKEKEKELNDDDNIVHVEQQQLPLGWIRCCDDEGVIYYWHKPTGTVQRHPPALSQSQQSLKYDRELSNNNLSSILNSNRTSVSPIINTSENNSPNHQFNDNVYLNINYTDDNNHTISNSSSPNSIDNSKFDKDDIDECSNSSHSSSNTDLVRFNRRFYVRSLGWVRISEQDLTPDKSSKAVNKCIHDLSHGFKDYNDVVARWGEGKDLFMDIEDNYLMLVDPIENKILNKQAITSIRVWGVGRDNGRDFAYVARDKLTKVHMCHVFRCEDVPAKEIANTLRDVCKQIMLKKGLIQKAPKQLRPNLLNELKKQEHQNECNNTNEIDGGVSFIKFPTPVEEPKKTINCKYVGSIDVNRPNGMNVLNDAIDQLYLESYKSYLNDKKHCSDFIINENDYEDIEDLENILLNKDKTIDFIKSKWQNAALTISPSTIYSHKINDDETSELLFECRIRYLAFLGISKNPKLCGLIEHCADNTFKCHTFYNEPSCGTLCKTVEAACKLRYQKCLDAHPEATKCLNQNNQANNSNNNNNNKGLGTQLKNMFDLIRSRKKR